MRLYIVMLVLLALAACTTVPEQIQGDFPDISPARVEPGVYGSDVRWGGIILGSRNSGSETCFEILSRDLDKYLRPELEDHTAGRFIACKSGFHDPLVFEKGREVTVTGSIERTEVRKVDDFDYRYPVMDVDNLVLWKKRRNVVVWRGYHDPFYNPWYWGPYWGAFPYHRYGWPMHRTGYAETRTLLPDPAIIETRD